MLQWMGMRIVEGTDHSLWSMSPSPASIVSEWSLKIATPRSADPWRLI